MYQFCTCFAVFICQLAVICLLLYDPVTVTSLPAGVISGLSGGLMDCGSP